MAHSLDRVLDCRPGLPDLQYLPTSRTGAEDRRVLVGFPHFPLPGVGRLRLSDGAPVRARRADLLPRANHRLKIYNAMF